QDPLMVLGWLVSGPTVPRPRSSEAPESQDRPTVAHLGARSVASKAAVWSPPPPVGFTVRLMLVLWVSEPEVPVTVTVNVPVVAVPDAARVRVEEPGAVTEPGAKEAVTPLGVPLALRLTEPPKPFRLPMLMVLVPLPPWVTVTEVGEAEMLKSGTG